MLSSRRLAGLGLPTYLPTRSKQCLQQESKGIIEKEREAGCGVVRALGNELQVSE